MKQKRVPIIKDGHLILRCAIDGQLVKVKERVEVPVPDGVAIWWHCPGCGGWHAVVFAMDKQSK